MMSLDSSNSSSTFPFIARKLPFLFTKGIVHNNNLGKALTALAVTISNFYLLLLCLLHDCDKLLFLVDLIYLLDC